jgi:glycosyltransferase involved in cell wall biosynthesis
MGAIMRTLEDFSFTQQPGKYLEKSLQQYQTDCDTHVPAISIVTPYYDSDEHMEQTFNCVMNQTFADFEWLIVDDGSTRPEAVEKLEQFAGKDDRIRVIHQKNGGQSVAKNRGIHNSRADIIVFLDADDLIEEFYLEILYKALQEYPDAAWSYTDLVGFGSWEYLWCKPFSAGRMTFNNTLVNAAAFRKSALEDVDYFTELYKHYDEDWALYLKLLGTGYHPVHVPVIGFWYRRSENGMQQSVRKDDELRRKSDAYIEQLSRSVDIHIRGEEYKGTLPEKAVRTQYSGKEKLLTGVLAWPVGVKFISKIYKKKGK